MSRMGTSAGPFYVGTEVETTENEGAETVETWQGSETECRSMLNLLRARGATRIRLSAGPEGDWQARGNFPFDDQNPVGDLVDTMELDTNVVQRSIFQSPVFRSRFSDYDSTTHHSTRADRALGIVKDTSNKYLRGLTEEEIQTNLATYGSALPGATATAEDAILAELFYRLDADSTGFSNPEKLAASLLYNNIAFRGVTSFLEYQQVFRRTVTAGSPLAVRANFTGAGKIWTTGEVIAWEGIPADGWFVLPAGVQWHKDKPSVTKAYGQKTQLSYHYTEIKTASGLLYEAYGSAVLIDLP